MHRVRVEYTDGGALIRSFVVRDLVPIFKKAEEETGKRPGIVTLMLTNMLDSISEQRIHKVKKVEIQRVQD